MEKFLKMLPENLILLLNLVQHIWWMILTLVFQENNYIVCYLQILCILLRIAQQICIDKKISQYLMIQIISLSYYVLYFESILQISENKQLVIMSTIFILIVTYYYYIVKIFYQWIIICKFGFPFYIIVRIISVLFISHVYIEVEALIEIIIIFFSIYLQEHSQLKQSEKITKSRNQQQKKNENDSDRQIGQKKSQKFTFFNKSLSRLSPALTPIQNQSFFIKEQSIDSKLLQFSQLSNNMRQRSNQQKGYFTDKTEMQIIMFYQNIINTFPQGVILLNQYQQVIYMNNKCEKLFECGPEFVVENIKQCIDTAQVQNDDISEITNLLKSNRLTNQLNQQYLEQIISYYQKQNEQLDIFDVMLFPQKYISELSQKLVTENDRDDSRTDQLTFYSNCYIFQSLLQKNQEQNKVKKLKIKIFPTVMSPTQQEYLSLSSNLRQNSKINGSNNNNEQLQQNPVLLILIKNVTTKHQVQRMKSENIIHNSLLKSFSHELRTPLNSCQDMLNLIQFNVTQYQTQIYIKIAQCSITLLIHQINDILDYAAMQSLTFQYHLTTFPLISVVQEIENIYSIQMKAKNIDFRVETQSQLLDLMIYSDKQRILQVLVNLLNNSCKYTPEHGIIVLELKSNHFSLITIKVKDTGIGIDDEKLTSIQNCLISQDQFPLQQQPIEGTMGLGLNIAAKLVEGLIDTNKNQLTIKSRKNNGTVVKFKIQNFHVSSNESQLQPLWSQITGRFNNSCLIQTLSERKFEDKLVKRQQSLKSNQMSKAEQEIFIVDSASDISSQESPRLNDNVTENIKMPVNQNFIIRNQHNQQINSLCQYSFTIQNCNKCIPILIVDDIPFNQIALQLMLKHYQLECDQAFDGIQAIQKVKFKLETHCQYYKLIFMDIEMPGLNGFQASKQILDLTGKQTTIIICSAYDSHENFIEGQRIGITTFLPKPVNQKDLEIILKQVFPTNFLD